MTTTTDSTATILGYNTWLFGNAVKDVGQDQADHRVSETTNPFDRLAGHVTIGRHGITAMLKIEVPEVAWGPFADFGQGVQFDSKRPVPPLTEITAHFHRVTGLLMAGLPNVPQSLLDSPANLPIPGENPTMRDQLAFMTMHETYHIGQMGLLKKHMGGEGIMGG